MRKIALAFTILLSITAFTANAQYFGRNKVQWEHFNFKIMKTEHFEIRFDPKNDKALARYMAPYLEELYADLSTKFQHKATPPILIADRGGTRHAFPDFAEWCDVS